MITFEVLEVWSKFFQDIDLIRIKLSENTNIKSGFRFHDAVGDQWLIKGVVRHMVYSDPALNEKKPILEDFEKGIYDCLIEPINHDKKIEVRDTMSLIQ